MKIRRIFDNIEIKLICLLLAFVVWLYANRSPGSWWLYQATKAIEESDHGIITFPEVPVRLVGVQEKAWKPDPGKVGVRCLATEFEMSDFQLVVQLTQRDEDELQVILTKDNVKLPNGLVFLKAEPRKIEIISVP